MWGGGGDWGARWRGKNSTKGSSFLMTSRTSGDDLDGRKGLPDGGEPKRGRERGKIPIEGRGGSVKGAHFQKKKIQQMLHGQKKDQGEDRVPSKGKKRKKSVTGGKKTGTVATPPSRQSSESREHRKRMLVVDRDHGHWGRTEWADWRGGSETTWASPPKDLQMRGGGGGEYLKNMSKKRKKWGKWDRSHT